MAYYTDCFDYKYIRYCNIGNGKVIVGDNTTEILNAAVDKKLFSTLTIPESVYGKKITEIGSSAFEGQVNLVSITIKAKIKQINYCAFYLCTSLRSINIPSFVNYICPSSISCISESKSTANGTLHVFFDYPSSIKNISRFCFERIENVVIFYGGYEAPLIDEKTFYKVSNVTIYSPENISFNSYRSIAIGRDFFLRNKCILTMKIHPYFHVRSSLLCIFLCVK